MVQNVYVKGIELGHFEPNKVDSLMTAATHGIIGASAFYDYSLHWAEAYLNQKLDQVNHRILRVPSSQAQFAVSSVYSPLADHKGIALNIFPYKGDTVAIWSYPMVQYSHFKAHLDELSQTESDYRKYVVSKLVLQHCENFVLAPSFFKSLSHEQIESMKKYYLANTSVEKVDYEDKNLFIF